MWFDIIKSLDRYERETARAFAHEDMKDTLQGHLDSKWDDFPDKERYENMDKRELMDTLYSISDSIKEEIGKAKTVEEVRAVIPNNELTYGYVRWLLTKLGVNRPHFETIAYKFRPILEERIKILSPRFGSTAA
jgi:hypothetical protein